MRCARCSHITRAPPQQPVTPTPPQQDTAQLCCTNAQCRVVLMYPRGASQVQCSLCGTLNCAAQVRRGRVPGGPRAPPRGAQARATPAHCCHLNVHCRCRFLRRQTSWATWFAAAARPRWRLHMAPAQSSAASATISLRRQRPGRSRSRRSRSRRKRRRCSRHPPHRQCWWRTRHPWMSQAMRCAPPPHHPPAAAPLPPPRMPRLALLGDCCSEQLLAARLLGWRRCPGMRAPLQVPNITLGVTSISDSHSAR